MNNRYIHYLVGLLTLFVVFTACEETTFENNAKGNFDALWTIIDQNYCFLDYKEINWDEIYYKYHSRISNNMSKDALFTLMGEMLSELRDGHVNLSAAHDITRYWKWSEDYPTNFDSAIQDLYLGKDYRIAAGMYYKILDDNVGYVYYRSFSNNVGHGNLSEVLNHMLLCKGIIIDIRSNGGGSLTNVDRIASRFFNEKTLVGYITHKTGKGHNDFSDYYPKYISSYNGLRYQKPVVVLTNRGCYSAANDFANVMRYAPNAILMGDKTGGGSGLPFSSELPNGWSIRFSASPIYDVNKNHIEFGIEPDIYVSMTAEDAADGKDTIIEAARDYINLK